MFGLSGAELALAAVIVLAMVVFTGITAYVMRTAQNGRQHSVLGYSMVFAATAAVGTDRRQVRRDGLGRVDSACLQDLLGDHVADLPGLAGSANDVETWLRLEHERRVGDLCVGRGGCSGGGARSTEQERGGDSGHHGATRQRAPAERSARRRAHECIPRAGCGSYAWAPPSEVEFMCPSRHDWRVPIQ